MKEKIKVICKKLKNKLPLLLACLLVGAMVLGLYVFSQSKQVNTLSASAEEASTVAETADVESGIDLTQYPSANLYRYSVARKYHNLGAGTKVENVGLFGFDCTGKVSSDPYIGTYANGWFRAGGEHKVLPVLPAVEAGQQVNISFDITLYETIPEYTSFSVGVHLLFDAFNVGVLGPDIKLLNNTEKQSFTVSRVVPETYAGRFPFIAITLNSLHLLIENIMVTYGDTVYPFVPPLDYFYENGYNAGYDVGETDGKEIGYSDGLDKARAGYWNDSKVYVNLNGTSNGATVNSYLEISPTITSNGVDLSNVYTEINAKYPNFISTNTTFGFEFVSPVYFDGLDVRCIGDTSVLVDREMIAIVYDPKTKKESGVDCRFILIDGSDNVAGFQTATMREEFFGKQLKSFGTFTVQNISQFKNMRFYSNEVIANLNYQAGYQAGILDNTLYQKGYDKGFELGEKKGFDEGVIKGQTNDPYDLGDFLFSIIDAPFRIIREALNFEFLGFNVSEILFFIITISLFAFVLKYIRGA